MDKYRIEYDIISHDVDSKLSVVHVSVPVVYSCQLANYLVSIVYPVQNFVLTKIL